MSDDDAEQPSTLGNLLFLVGSFFASALVAAAVVEAVRPWTGGDGGIGSSILVGVTFAVAFLGLLLFYDRYYPDG